MCLLIKGVKNSLQLRLANEMQRFNFNVPIAFIIHVTFLKKISLNYGHRLLLYHAAVYLIFKLNYT